jgi:hypothetical protein
MEIRYVVNKKKRVGGSNIAIANAIDEELIENI